MRINYAKVCSATGEGMNSGYYAKLNDEEYFFKYSEDATFWCLVNGYQDIDEAFDKGVIEYLEWDGNSAGVSAPFIESCTKTTSYNMIVCYNDSNYQVNYSKVSDSWLGDMSHVTISDEFGYIIDEHSTQVPVGTYDTIKNFVISVKDYNE